MDNAASIRNFIKELKQVREKTMKSLMQFQLEVALGLQKQIQQNIKDTFGANKADRSAFTRAAMGNTARTSGRSGALFRSVQIEKTPGGNLAVSIGGVGVPYANIHETGGTIYPKTAKYLTIPVSPEYVGRRAREFNLVMGRDPIWGMVLKTRSGQAAYALRERVNIPKREYVKPAVDKIQEDPRVRMMLMASFRSLQAEVIIE